MKGTPTPPDPLGSLRTAAGSGVPEAMFKLAVGLVTQQRFEEAFDLHRQAAEAGHVGAQIELARMLMHGIAGDPDPRLAVHWLERAETAGQPIAGYYLAMMQLGTVAMPRDGLINHRVLAAVQADFPPAIRAAAIHFGRKQSDADQTVCLQLLSRGSNLGDVVAAQLLAERLQRGEGCQPQPQAAAQLRAQLAAVGHKPLPSISVPIPPLVLPLRESGRVEPGVLALEEVLQPAPMQVMSRRPHVMRIDKLLSADECRLLVAHAQPNLRRSQTVDPETGQPVALEIRTSSDASVDPITEDLALRMVQLRMARSARVELSHAEHLTVLRYEPGEEYRPHRDYRPPSSIERDRPEAGNRARTICVYLNDVEAGGETDFPLAGVRIAPVAGRAVVFDNLFNDGRPDPESLHAGLPIAHGEKWLATLWLRERRYRHY
ncbi:2OG-Fe(II) oxygenase [Lysobacter koreensis]|uniref:2OG-Fe(II) oxygenase n=1 Tax=Lysobacter koreensis TaxID=266122 RepID=A0ABW2YJZ5_9GAMM